MKMIDVRLTKDIIVVVNYRYKPEIPGVYDRLPEDCYESEPEEIEIADVVFKGVDIFELLSEDTISSIEMSIHNKEVNQ
jgi:hypothetical protein